MTTDFTFGYFLACKSARSYVDHSKDPCYYIHSHSRPAKRVKPRAANGLLASYHAGDRYDPLPRGSSWLNRLLLSVFVSVWTWSLESSSYPLTILSPSLTHFLSWVLCEEWSVGLSARLSVCLSELTKEKNNKIDVNNLAIIACWWWLLGIALKLRNKDLLPWLLQTILS